MWDELVTEASLKKKDKIPTHNFESSHVCTCQILTSFPWKVDSFYNTFLHNVSALLGILMKCLRVKTKAVGLQIFFRLFLLVGRMDGIMLLNKNPRKPTTKSGIETNCNFDFIKTNSEIIKWENVMLLKHWLGLWVQWNLQRKRTVLSSSWTNIWSCLAIFWRLMCKALYLQTWKLLFFQNGQKLF